MLTIFKKLQNIKDKISNKQYHYVFTDYLGGSDTTGSIAFDATTVDYDKLLADIEDLENYFKTLNKTREEKL